MMKSRLLLAGIAALMLAAPARAAMSEKDAVLTALDDEYKAYATYDAVIQRFGAVRPFVNIIRAEDTHFSALIDYMIAQGWDVPANPYLTGAKSLGDLPDTLQGACKLGVQAEIDNAALYTDKLLPVVQGNAQLSGIFTALYQASQNKHLPAFQRCAGR